MFFAKVSPEQKAYLPVKKMPKSDCKNLNFGPILDHFFPKIGPKSDYFSILVRQEMKKFVAALVKEGNLKK